MKNILFTLFSLSVFSLISYSQTFTPADQNCAESGTITSNVSATLSTITATDGVKLTPKLWLSSTILDNDLAADCISLNDCSQAPYPAIYPPCATNAAYKRKPTFSYSNIYVPSGGYTGGSGPKPIYITRNTTSNTASSTNPSVGTRANIQLDFVSGTNIRPQGLSFKICDIDNPYDRVQVKVYSSGSLVDYTYTIGSYITVSNDGSYLDANFSVPTVFQDNDAIFTSLAWNSASATTNWDNAKIAISVSNTSLTIDSVVVTNVTREGNRNDMNPAWAVGDFQWTNTVTLPLTLLQFSGISKNCKAVLSWETAAEINTDYFSIEESIDGVSFSQVAMLKASGELSQIKAYEIWIVQPSAEAFYRLKMVDRDGKYAYSKTIKIFTNCMSITVQPNPTAGLIKIGGTQKGDIINVYNMEGRLILRKSSNPIYQAVELGNYENGNYIITVIRKDRLVFSDKVVKK